MCVFFACGLGEASYIWLCHIKYKNVYIRGWKNKEKQKITKNKEQIKQRMQIF